MKKRSECTCICHQPGMEMIHIMPCCDGDSDPLGRVLYELTEAEKKISITEEELLAFADDYRNDPIKSKHLRAGQAFCNHFGIHDSDLFYCTDLWKTVKMMKKYIR